MGSGASLSLAPTRFPHVLLCRACCRRCCWLDEQLQVTKRGGEGSHCIECVVVQRPAGSVGRYDGYRELVGRLASHANRMTACRVTPFT